MSAAMVAGGQTLAPSSAQAMIDQNMSEGECGLFFGTWDWFTETCDVNIGGGDGGGGGGWDPNSPYLPEPDGGGGGGGWDADSPYLPVSGDDEVETPHEQWVRESDEIDRDREQALRELEEEMERRQREAYLKYVREETEPERNFGAVRRKHPSTRPGASKSKLRIARRAAHPKLQS